MTQSFWSTLPHPTSYGLRHPPLLTRTQIAYQLDLVACGLCWDEKALKQALDLPNLAPEDKALLNRYLRGNIQPGDGWALQRFAMNLNPTKEQHDNRN